MASSRKHTSDTPLPPAKAPRNWLANVLRTGQATSGLDGVGCEPLIAAAEDEGVVMLVLPKLLQNAADAEMHATLQHLGRRHAMQELQRLAEARHAIAALDAGGVQVLVLKGAALAYWLYPDPVQRPRYDLDMLVAGRAAAGRAIDALGSAGYAAVADIGLENTPDFEIALKRGSATGSHVIDLHWHLLNHSVLARGFDFEALWALSIPIPELHPQARGLGRVHALVHALLHRVTNMPSGHQDRLIWLYDIHLLAESSSEEDWAFFLQLCRDKHIAAPCRDGLEACVSVLATKLPSEVEDELRRLSVAEPWKFGRLGQGAMDRAHLSALPLRQKVSWLRRKLFPSPEFMRHRYGPQGGFGLLHAYIARWWVGLKRAAGG